MDIIYGLEGLFCARPVAPADCSSCDLCLCFFLDLWLSPWPLWDYFFSFNSCVWHFSLHCLDNTGAHGLGFQIFLLLLSPLGSPMVTSFPACYAAGCLCHITFCLPAKGCCQLAAMWPPARHIAASLPCCHMPAKLSRPATLLQASPYTAALPYRCRAFSMPPICLYAAGPLLKKGKISVIWIILPVLYVFTLFVLKIGLWN